MPKPNSSPLLPNTNTKPPIISRTVSRFDDELSTFRSCLRLTCIDQTTTLSSLFSYSIFLLLTIAVPSLSHFVLLYSDRRRPYDAVVQLSLSAASSLAFLSLSVSLRKYGLRKFLFLDKMVIESRWVQSGYAAQLRRSVYLMGCYTLPSFIAECGYKIWWYFSGARRIPFLGNPILSDIAACSLELLSWSYRTATFFLVCVLFRLICYLQILRLQDFATAFQEESDVAAVLSEYLRIRKQLMVISHRFRRFIVGALVLVTASQWAALLLTTRAGASGVDFFDTGELALSSVILVAGLLICIRSAAKITHKAQALTSHAAKWHVCATVESFYDPETPCAPTDHIFSKAVWDESRDEDDEAVDDEDELEGMKLLHPHANTISFQKRQALVTYLENNRAGITVFGFVLDRRNLQLVFMIQLSLFLWLLGKTIGIS